MLRQQAVLPQRAAQVHRVRAALPVRPRSAIVVRAEGNGRNSDSFLAGVVVGGVVFGALGFLFAPQISKAILGDDQRLKLPRFLEDEQPKDPEQTKQDLIEKIAQLNASIDEVAAQLKEYWEKKAPHERTASMLPRSQLGPDGPFDGTTSYGTNFQAPAGAGPAQSFKPPAGEKENLPFSPWTTYKVDYPAKDVPYNRVRPANKLQPAAGPFQDSTTMKESFPGWAGAKPSTPAAGRSVSVPRAVGPFDGVSAYKVAILFKAGKREGDDYRRWPGARPQPAVPLLGQRAALPGGAFNDATTHRSVYTPKQVSPPERVRHSDETMRPDGWYDGVPSTEYRRHYVEKAGDPPPRAAATTGASGAALPKGPFSGSTTYGTEFRPRTAPEYERAGRPADDPRDSGPFEGVSTYKDTYVKKDVPYQRIRPSAKLQPAAGPFQDTTEMKTSFQNWGTQPVTKAGPSASGNLASVGPFDGTTTYRTDFHKMNGGLRAMAGRPTSGTRALRGKGPFEGVSMYTTDYIPKPYQPVESYKPCECDGDPDCELAMHGVGSH
ncbi:hypothetical protein VOLCADRAFT_102859 [Volvox carteri f. nagariensis]|uniref:Uncharacterized protein n=1 Tax=Volvox carteri f. nagariensis TaxID=3068 RepID=D8TIJ1_VOLCA|nr:uncharacterized protein VOLCADRAFT_102859 [Volvox carteri f. nagariensis]EFJ53250.1 hypothetical protein VOLCADRAFT_102859 [Volvox carteri f. nagariensis]|eukprot:XP_002946255.1 hypothetical protein VOLCADRAFT_102859 [Volvox carteri f. nagariensis]